MECGFLTERFTQIRLKLLTHEFIYKEMSMRKVIFQMLTTLDGYFEGPDKEIDWHNVDDEFNNFAKDVLNNVDTLIFGRVTYQLMADYWPSVDALKDDPVVAGYMNSLNKIVVSKTLKSVEWNNTKLIRQNVDDEILKLKKQPGKAIVIFGSSDLTVSLMKNNLVDEFRILINPVILGKGKPLFQGLNERYKLKLVSTQAFNSGNVMLIYKPDNTM